MYLGRVIDNLCHKRKIIGYKNSPLTKLLKDSLGGNCKTTLLAMLSPDLNS